jgi:hypothetical protein
MTREDGLQVHKSKGKSSHIENLDCRVRRERLELVNLHTCEVTRKEPK